MKEYEYQNYKMTKVYKEATKGMKRAIEAYISEYKPVNNHLYLQLRLYELNHLSKKEMRTPPLSYSIIVLVLVIVFYIFIGKSTNVWLMFSYSAAMIVLMIGYFLGWFSQAKMEIRTIRKELKKFPEIPDFKGTDK